MKKHQRLLLDLFYKNKFLQSICYKILQILSLYSKLITLFTMLILTESIKSKQL